MSRCLQMLAVVVATSPAICGGPLPFHLAVRRRIEPGLEARVLIDRIRELHTSRVSSPCIDTQYTIRRLETVTARTRRKKDLEALSQLLRAIVHILEDTGQAREAEFLAAGTALVHLKGFLSSQPGYGNVVMTATVSACVSLVMCDRLLRTGDNAEALLGLAEANRRSTQVYLYAAAAREANLSLPDLEQKQFIRHGTLMCVFRALNPPRAFVQYVEASGFPPVSPDYPGADEEPTVLRYLTPQSQIERLTARGLISALPMLVQWDDVAVLLSRLAMTYPQRRRTASASLVEIQSACRSYDPPLECVFTGRGIDCELLRNYVAFFDLDTSRWTGTRMALGILQGWRLSDSGSNKKAASRRPPSRGLVSR